MLDRLVPVEESTQLGAIGGYICKPEFAKKSRGEQYFFVNDRFVKSPYLHHAVLAGFEGLIKSDTYPGYFIYFQVPPESIDINIHPTKTEVKFEDEQSLYAILRSAIKHSLGQFNIAPVLDFDTDPGLDTPYGYKDRNAKIPAVSVDRDFNPFESDYGGSRKSYNKPSSSGNWQALYEGLPGASEEGQSPEWIIESDATQEQLFKESDFDSDGAAGLFQIGKKYIVTRIKSGILLVHQQRAHQRVLYEKLLEILGHKTPETQTLLFPVTLSYTTEEQHILSSLQEELSGLGFDFGKDASGLTELTGLPGLIPPAAGKDLLDSIIADWQYHEGSGDLSHADRIAKTLCRGMAIKTGTALDCTSQQALIHDLFACKEPDLSPFNQPIHTRLTMDEMDKKLNTYG
jgi:DNA mismatch repair protein MutL